MTELARLRDRPITVADKGFGPLAAGRELAAQREQAGQPLTAGWLAAHRPPLHSGAFSYPLLTLRESALRHNIDGMARYCAAAGVELAPHGKATMAPQLAARQLDADAWGITVATIGQLQAYRSFGVRRLLLASELVDPAGIGWLAAALAADPGFTAYCYVDSLAGVAGRRSSCCGAGLTSATTTDSMPGSRPPPGAPRAAWRCGRPWSCRPAPRSGPGTWSAWASPIPALPSTSGG